MNKQKRVARLFMLLIICIICYSKVVYANADTANAIANASTISLDTAFNVKATNTDEVVNTGGSDENYYHYYSPSPVYYKINMNNKDACVEINCKNNAMSWPSVFEIKAGETISPKEIEMYYTGKDDIYKGAFLLDKNKEYYFKYCGVENTITLHNLFNDSVEITKSLNGTIDERLFDIYKLNATKKKDMLVLKTKYASEGATLETFLIRKDGSDFEIVTPMNGEEMNGYDAYHLGKGANYLVVKKSRHIFDTPYTIRTYLGKKNKTDVEVKFGKKYKGNTFGFGDVYSVYDDTVVYPLIPNLLISIKGKYAVAEIQLDNESNKKKTVRNSTVKVFAEYPTIRVYDKRYKNKKFCPKSSEYTLRVKRLEQ